MKNIHKLFFGIAMTAMLAGCSEDKETNLVQEIDPEPQSSGGTLITVTAAMDTDQSLSKVSLAQADNSLDLISRWQEGDKIQVFARQDGKCYTIDGEVAVEKISSDGKTCSFNILLPGAINTSKSYQVYGVCGVEGATFKDGVVTFDAAAQRKPLTDFKAPLMFTASASSTTVEAKFSHIGTYEILHVVNNAGGFNFTHNGYSVASPWYYDNFTCSINFNNATPTPTATRKTGEADIQPLPVGDRQEAVLVSWYVPNGGTITNATLKAKINDTEVSSVNAKTSNVVIKAGNAYHLYATWDGTELKFVDHTVTEIAPAVTYRLSSKQWVFVGDESKMTVTANTNCHISVLINGKEVKSVDDITTFDMTLPTDNPGEFDITLRASAGGIDAKDVTFKFGVRENYDDVNVKTFDICGVPVKMVFVKGGTFMMGGTAEQGRDAADDEFPVHAVSLDDYYIGQIEVTRELYKKVFGRNKEVVPDDSKYPQGDMSWNSTMEFINKLRDTTGMDFRLPTEAEWEYAARGGQRSKNYKYSGSNLVSMVANYNANSGNQTIPCGTKMNNELGIFDMSGNVCEFVSDPYSTYPEDPVYNPQGAGYNHILRGGGGGASAADCRVSRRSYYSGKSGWDGDLASWDFGIRLAIRP